MKTEDNNEKKLDIRVSKLKDNLKKSKKKMDAKTLINASKEIDKIVEEYFNEHKK